MLKRDTIYGVLNVIAGFLIHLSFGCMYTIGNMTPYLASYVAKYINPDFNKGLVVWVSASALAAQGLFMPLGGLCVQKIGVKVVVSLGCLINRFVCDVQHLLTPAFLFERFFSLPFIMLILCSGAFMLTYFALQYGFVWVLVTHLISLGLGVGLAYSVVMQAAATVCPAFLSPFSIQPI